MHVFAIRDWAYMKEITLIMVNITQIPTSMGPSILFVVAFSMSNPLFSPIIGQRVFGFDARLSSVI